MDEISGFQGIFSKQTIKDFFKEKMIANNYIINPQTIDSVFNFSDENKFNYINLFVLLTSKNFLKQYSKKDFSYLYFEEFNNMLNDPLINS